MIDEVGPKSIVVGGKVDENEKYVEPTVLKGKKRRVLLRFFSPSKQLSHLRLQSIQFRCHE